MKARSALGLAGVFAFCNGISVDMPSWAPGIVHDLKAVERLTAADFMSLRVKLVKDVLSWGKSLKSVKMEYPYYAFLPNLAAVIPMDGTEVSLESPCFQRTSFRVVGSFPGSLRVVIRAHEPATPSCSDFYMLATTSSFHLEQVVIRGEHTVQWNLPDDVTDGELWDMRTQGIRIFRFTTTVAESLYSIFMTASLFEPILANGVNPRAESRNAAFMKAYAGFDLEPRDPAANVELSPLDVKSGDMFLIVRMDGLDPMLAWGMGSTTGHVTVALWIEGELYVIESQVKSRYWPVDNVQRTPFKQWLQQAQEANYNVLHVPLSDHKRGAFNETAALAYLESVEGFEYGYHNILWGWVDTLKDNYPCMPPDFKRCLEWEFLEVAFALVDRHIPAIADLLWTEAFNLRLGTQGLRTSDLWMEAAKKNMSSQELPVVVEQDKWMYHTTRYNRSSPAVGPSMVCCVFVCNVWKSAGVFGDLADEFNCAELTNADDYSLQLFQGHYSQILGRRTMFLPRFNTQSPYAHMDEKCPGVPPLYERPAGC